MMRFALTQRLKQPILLLIVLLLPAAALAGWAYLGERTAKEVKIPVAIADLDQSDFSKTLIERLKKQERLSIIPASEESAKTMLLREEADTVFIIKEGFKESIMEGDREGIIEMRVSPLSVASGVVREIASSEVIRFTSNAKAAERAEKIADKYAGDYLFPENVGEKAYERADEQWEPKPLMTIRYEAAGGKEESSAESPSGLLQSPLQVWTVLTLVLCMFTTDWVVKEKDVLYKRIQTLPAGLNGYVVNTLSSFWVLHFLQAGISWLIMRTLAPGMPAHILIPMAGFITLAMCISLFAASLSAYPGIYYATGSVWIFILCLAGGRIIPAGEIIGQLEQLEAWMPQAPLYNWEISSGLAWLKMGAYAALSSLLAFLSISRLRSAS